MKNEIKNIIKKVLITFICIFINLFGKYLATTFQLPLWMDSFGTVFAAYVFGPVYGAVVGCTVNIVHSFNDIYLMVYSINSIFIGISSGMLARKRKFETFYGITSAIGIVTIGSTVLSIGLNLILNDGIIGNVWGEGVKNFLIEKDVQYIVATTIGIMYLEFVDKLVTMLAMFYLIKTVRFFRNKTKRRTVNASAIIIALTVGMLCLPVQTKAEDVQEDSYIQQIYNADDGLLCGHANDVVQTSDGILWVAGYSGLYRYNGISFRQMNEFDSVKNANCLYVDNNGRLWIGTNDNGIVIADNEKITGILNSDNGLPSDSVRSIVRNSEGDYYVGTSDNLAVIRLENGINVFNIIPEVRYAQSVSADKKGNVAAVTAEGRLYILNNGKLDYEIIPENDNILFSACSFDNEGILYTGTVDGNIYIYDISENAKVQSNIECKNMSKINQIYFQNDIIWILTDNGIGTIQDEIFLHEETGEFNSSIQKMIIDYQGNLWFASSRQGLLQYAKSPFVNLTSKYGVEPDVTNTTAIRDEYLYVGMDTGLSIINLDEGIVEQNELTKLLDTIRIRCMMVDSQNNLWICSYGKGLIKVTPENNIIEYDVGKRIRVCIELADGRIVAGGDSGLTFIHNENDFTVIPYGDELGASQVLSICELSDGRLFIGTDGNGIIQIENEKIIKHISKAQGLSSDVILRMIEDSDRGNMFIVTSNGICYMKDNTISLMNNFPYSNNYDIVMDDDGEMFVLSSAGIYVVERDRLVSGEDLNYKLLNVKAGFSGALTANSWNALSKDKKLYLSSDRGVFMVNIDEYKPDRVSYRLSVSKMRIDYDLVDIEPNAKFSIMRNVKEIGFSIEVINYSLEELEISYYLEGFDSKYRTVKQSHAGEIVYTDIPPGEYTFHLVIFDKDQGTIIEESRYNFYKEKEIYDNDWFIAYMIIVGGVFIGGLTWYITRTAVQRKLEHQQERLAFALKQVQMGNETILAIAKTVDAKDSLTSKHSQRVSDYSVLIAKKYGFSEKELENLRKAALLHDIGKIGIPDAILNKPSRLTNEEYGIMKTHATRGAEILKDFTLIEHVVEGAKYHHERYDGNGYPDGISKEEIPLYGRIISIADAFDAMTSNRVYRQKQDFDYVISELKKGRGTQFDPELTDIFLKIIEDGEIDIMALYKEA